MTAGGTVRLSWSPEATVRVRFLTRGWPRSDSLGREISMKLTTDRRPRARRAVRESALRHWEGCMIRRSRFLGRTDREVCCHGRCGRSNHVPAGRGRDVEQACQPVCQKNPAHRHDGLCAGPHLDHGRGGSIGRIMSLGRTDLEVCCHGGWGRWKNVLSAQVSTCEPTEAFLNRVG